MKQIQITVCVCLVCIFIVFSCSNKGQAIRDPKQMPKIIEEVSLLNQKLIKNKIRTKESENLKGWEIVKADAVGVYNTLLDNEQFAQYSYDEYSTEGFERLIVKTSVKAAWASIKAYADKYNMEFQVNYPYDRFVLCLECVGKCTVLEGQKDYSGVGNQNIIMGEPIEEEPDDDIIIPTEYIWTDKIAKCHNLALSFWETNEEQIFDNYEEHLCYIERMYGLDSLYKVSLEHDMENITYNMNYATYFDKNKPAEQVLILFDNLYKSYVENIEDVKRIVNQYISVVDKTNDLTTTEKIAIVGALNAIVYSSEYWNDYLTKELSQNMF